MANLQNTQTALSISQLGDDMLSNIQFKEYETRITRERPAAFVFLIDQSGSMAEKWGLDNSKSKADIVADYVNNAINELLNVCQKSGADPLPYFEICVIGYGKDAKKASVIWEGNLAGKIFVTPAELKNNPTGNAGEIEIQRTTFKGTSTVKIPVPYWFYPTAKQLTPMGSALDLAAEVTEEWVQNHQNCFPPIVINITDGQQTDCKDDELIKKAYELKTIKTLYGNLLLFNIQISENDSESIYFPKSKAEISASENSELLYNLSSVLPDIFNKRISTEIKMQDFSPNTKYVAMAYQASVSTFIKFLDIGTRTVKVS